MRSFALNGDFDMVKRLHVQMWPDTVGTISLSTQEEADELLMEAAINDNQASSMLQAYYPKEYVKLRCRKQLRC
ncbi:hypothetical protein J5N97_003376 [Dioscorea zingiberensis]|uniref:Uncharacterized protein n=1 Tax=Dioscorea zingiberensis TaxID=325984 RepID=A0A9D5HQ11_9LILI|nr:hypothetical protein J5N97_003376 [Dioscorea zingiberensis]